MRKKRSSLLVTVVQQDHFLATYKAATDQLILFTKKDEVSESFTANSLEAVQQALVRIIADHHVFGWIYLAAEDEHPGKEISAILQQYNGRDICLLVPYREAPVDSQRIDERVKSFILPLPFLDVSNSYFMNPGRLIYELVHTSVSQGKSSLLKVVQVGRPQPIKPAEREDVSEALRNSLMVIPHKGVKGVLERCLQNIGQQLPQPGMINICFDDNTYKKMDMSMFRGLKADFMRIFKNTPAGVGPYLGRHYSIINSQAAYIFLQDSDDISLSGRLEQQLSEMNQRELDMIGCHELRLDVFSRSIVAVRYPLDVSAAFSYVYVHPLFHPTILIKREAYLKAGGFSTNRAFGNDSQFNFRASFFLKMGNVDEFLYLRYKRPNSLTTHAKTNLKTNRRKFLFWRWKVDFRLIRHGLLHLEDSSLRPMHHDYTYLMKEVTNEVWKIHS